MAKVDDMFNDLRDEINVLQARANGLDEADIAHLRAIYSIEFGCWYDPTHETDRLISEKLRPHIRALNEKFKFKA